jgi:vanillate O-demethylase monooxygenase subunit
MDGNQQGAESSTAEVYLRNTWYQAAWSYELGEKPLARTILGVPLLLFRSEGRPSAIFDRCPHRFAPLSAGKLENGVIECGYHGLAFDGSGRCVRNPHGPITSAMRTPAFPVVERYHGIWIWFGDADAADIDLLPDLSYIDDIPESARILMYMPTAANYRLLTDNIMDLSHADFLHPTTLGGVIADSKFRQYDRGNGLVAEWVNLDCLAPGVWQGKIPHPAKIDYYIDVEWQAPAVMTLSNTVVPTGNQITTADCYKSLHNMTPETDKSTHYFACTARPDHFPDDSSKMKELLEQAFLREDKPMVEAQQRRIGDADFWSLRPILLNIDTAGVKARRRLDRLIAEERATSAA